MWGQEYGQPLEAGRGKETDSPLDPPEGAQFLILVHDYISDLSSRTVR